MALDAPLPLNWQAVTLPEGCTLRRKETFEYVTAANIYDMELFQTQENMWYAIAIPREGERLIIYGSNEVQSAQMAIQIVVDKIAREGLENVPGADTEEPRR
ncbi:hypothetical protein JI721_02020 [Alicyclobacillus cycloheptanicus]|uniref:Uncharacterized protein n=1 Tax=Alicyclobacillus cycloheptanicus TaxID=1457 RepID=A0ABT9XGR0_9BACL|nr:hypothetical protein [Alicyclobacillus cycloheptanicus]MDQ0189003.1 hypothetical protein [Alicyclobacillus cycloheptanicus]WDM01656.1 hypothetical protein JI721_02020 [Alicyclobacillus cycloheptanicus]